jgi:TPR repeat protein
MKLTDAIGAILLITVSLAMNGCGTAAKGLDSKQSRRASPPSEQVRRQAEQGDPAAQFELGEHYLLRYPRTAQDAAQAAFWYRKAAEQGNASAQYELGVRYWYGTGVPFDAAQAAFWYRKAAEQGDILAQFALGELYEKGAGVPQDLAVASSWWRKAAANTDYRDHRGAPMDQSTVEFVARKATRKLAQQYLDRLDAETGRALASADASSARRQSEPHRDIEANDRVSATGSPPPSAPVVAESGTGLDPGRPFSEAEVQEIIRKTPEYRRAAEQGDAHAQRMLGTIYDMGIGLPADLSQAAVWYRKSADQGNPIAQFFLGTLYQTGEGVRKNEAHAAALYLKSAEKGVALAQILLGLSYKSGKGVPQDKSKAAFWFRKAADQGFSVAQELLDDLEAGSRVADTTSGSPETLREVRPERIAASRSSPFPPSPAPRPGYVTCRTNCYNADCYRTYSDGTQVHFQARRKWDSFSNSFEWDSGDC